MADSSSLIEKVRMGRQKPLKRLFPMILLFSVLFIFHRQYPFVLEMLTGKFGFLEGLSGGNSLNIAVIECPGGTDKGEDGHRKDSKYLVDALNKFGANTVLFQYTDASFDATFHRIVNSHKAHAYVSRVDPGEYEACDEDTYHAFLEKLMDAGVLPYNSPKDMINLGSKKSLLNLAGMYYFPNSTYVYSSLDQFDAFFPKTLKLHGSRVIKQNRGSKGEGVWWVELMDEKSSSSLSLSPFKTNSIVSNLLKLFSFQTSKTDPFNLKSPVPQFYSNLLPEFTMVEEKSVNLSEEVCEEGTNFPEMSIRLVEARDNHEERMSLLEFRNTVIKGYLNSSADFVVDMEYLPRIAEGEVRLILSGKEVLYIVNKQPQAANSSNTFSANLGAGATHNWEDPEEWEHVVGPFKKSLNKMLRRMKVDRAPILWTVDFIRYGRVDEKSMKFVISEINASCVGFSANPEMGEVIAKILVDQLVKELGISL